MASLGHVFAETVTLVYPRCTFEQTFVLLALSHLGKIEDTQIHQIRQTHACGLVCLYLHPAHLLTPHNTKKVKVLTWRIHFIVLFQCWAASYTVQYSTSHYVFMIVHKLSTEMVLRTSVT